MLGDPGRLVHLADELDERALRVRRLASTLRREAADALWSGAAARRFAELVGDRTAELERCAERLRLAALTVRVDAAHTHPVGSLVNAFEHDAVEALWESVARPVARAAALVDRSARRVAGRAERAARLLRDETAAAGRDGPAAPPHPTEGGFAVDGEDLARLATVFSDAAGQAERLSRELERLLADPGLVGAALRDPEGAVAAGTAVAAGVTGPQGLVVIAAELLRDASRLTASRLRYEAAESATRHAVGSALGDLARGAIGPAAAQLAGTPQNVLVDLVPCLGTAAEAVAAIVGNQRYVTELEHGGPLTVDPLLGRKLRSIAALLDDPAVDGAGGARVARDVAPWPPCGPPSRLGGLAATLRDVGALGAAHDGLIAIDTIGGAPNRYVVELPGIGWLGRSGHPQTLAGAIAAEATGQSAYARAVRKALRAARVPRGSALMLVGHSDGGIVALDLAADPSFNGPTGYHVTHVLAAGTPLTASQPTARSDTRVLTLDNVHDLVTQLGGGRSGGRSTARDLVDLFSANQGTVAANHAAALYAHQLAWLARDSRNPGFRGFAAGSVAYAGGPVTSRVVYSLLDTPSG